MRRLISDVYKVLFKVSNSKVLSLACALVYVSVLHLIVIYGICVLLEGWMPDVTIAEKLFAFPYSIILGIIMVIINFAMMLPLYKLSRDVKRRTSVAPILLYSLASLLLFLYIRFAR